MRKALRLTGIGFATVALLVIVGGGLIAGVALLHHHKHLVLGPVCLIPVFLMFCFIVGSMVEDAT